MSDLNRPLVQSGRDVGAAGRVGGICLLVASAVLPAIGYCQSSAEASWEAIKTCATLKEDKARFTCYDAVVRGAGLLPSAAELHRDTFGLPANAAAPPPPPNAADAPATPPAPVAAAPKSAAAPSVAANPARTAAPPVPAVAPAPVPTPAPPATPPAHDKLDVTIAKVDESRDGKFTVTTTEGAVWRQIESVTLHQPPLKGDTMTITEGFLGGFMCKSSKYVTFRCQRLR
ncbi:MAG TPA: hypothetical protein VGM84_24310 [Steroidobacteraceae bacterium]|jgi:hypothetical protein